MRIDNIVKEEIMRSLPVYFISFLIIGYLHLKGYISLGGLGAFILAFFVSAASFSLMVWYRKKEQLFDSSIFSIIGHIFQSKPRGEKNNEIYKNEKISIFSSIKKNISLLLITIFLYSVYLYASLVYEINQIFWFFLLLFIGSVFTKLIYGRSKADQKDPINILYFYIIICIFIFLRYIVLGYSVFPVLQGGIILGILLILLVLGLKHLHYNKN
jgi:hypothetical protein